MIKRRNIYLKKREIILKLASNSWDAKLDKSDSWPVRLNKFDEMQLIWDTSRDYSLEEVPDEVA